MKSRRKLRSRKAVTWLLIFGIGLTWLASMTILTVVMAQEIYDKLYEESYAFPDYVDQCGRLGDFYDKNFPAYGYQHDHPDVLENDMLEAISYNLQGSISSNGNYPYFSERSKLIRDIRYPLETAVLFYDGEGNLLHSSDDDVMFFGYFTQEQWDAGLETTSEKHYGWIDISEGKNAENWQDDPYLRFRTMYAGTRSLHDLNALRMTGTFDGTEFHPVSMYYLMGGHIREALESSDEFATEDGYAYTISGLDRTALLDWQLQFDNSPEHTGEELVTIYAEYPEMWDYEKTPLSYDGETYKSLAALTKTLDFPSWASICLYSNSFSGMGRYGLDELLVFGGWEYADYESYDYEAGTEPETEYIMVTAVRSHPLRCAVSALRNIYMVSGFAALILFFIIRSSIKNHLTEPLEQFSEALSGNGRLYRSENTPVPWREAEELCDFYISSADSQRRSENELNRLNAALDYAKKAEQNRRSMISAIAHELKTPLAVIHGYAEGLKEHIADEKREKYIDVILSETERTDALVLEMLDLSRLEAGRVKLARDDFSLVLLTRSVFEKLEMAINAKNLKISFDFPDDLHICADESRIAQVIENFTTNAIKYTPDGGNISVKLQKAGNDAQFLIENESAPLSQEALYKVWDTFYRADEARSGGGTGLGLAIAKNIIELHGGKCHVKNTLSGVEFGFTLRL